MGIPTENGSASKPISLIEDMLTSLSIVENQFAELQEARNSQRWLTKRSYLDFPVSNLGFCSICKVIRIDPDPTGVTCGNQNCIAKLGERLQAAEEEIDENEQERTDFKDKITQMAKLLKIKIEDENDISGNCDLTTAQLQRMTDVAERLKVLEEELEKLLKALKRV